jgi:hypothetical protein
MILKTFLDNRLFTIGGGVVSRHTEKEEQTLPTTNREF